MKIYSATIRADALVVRSRESYYDRQKRLFILVMVLVSVLPLLVISWASSRYYKHSWLQQTSIDLQSSAENRREIVDRFLVSQEDLLSSLVGLYGHDGLVRQENLERIFTAVNRSGMLIDLGVIDAQGAHLAYVGPYRRQLADRNYRDAPWFLATMRAGRYVSDVFTGFRGEPHFVVAVTDPTRSWLLRATINSALFNTLLASAQVGPDGDAFIINRQGEVQAQGRGGGAAVVSKEEFEAIQSDFGTVHHQHGNFLYATTWVNGQNWQLVLKTNITSSLAEFHRARGLGMVSIAVAACLIVAVAAFLVRSMMRRIESADRERAVLNNRMREVEKLALVGRLAASVAHEVNNPLQIIGDQAGWIEELLEDEAAGQVKNLDDYKAAVQKIKLHVGRASGITHRLLGFSRGTGLKKSETDINALVRDTASFLESEARSNRITVRFSLAEDLPRPTVDAGQLQQVFLNIINNAIDAIGSDGVITIQTRLDRDRLLVEIADSGPGLPEESLQRIFDPFFTTKKAGKGTGLGLSISRNIMQRMGGDIWAENGRQGGCRFTVSIPR